MLLSDHIGDFDAVQCSRGGSKRFEPTHVPYATLDKPMILFDQVIQILGPDRLDFGWAAKPIEGFVHLSNARRVDATFVDDNLARDSILRQRFGKETCCCWTVPALGQHEIKSIPSFVDGPIEVHPFAANRNIGLVHTP